MNKIMWTIEYFEGESPTWFEGFDTGTRTNGFIDIKVTPEVLDEYVDWLIFEGNCDMELITWLRDLPEGNDGLIDAGKMLIPVVETKEA